MKLAEQKNIYLVKDDGDGLRSWYLKYNCLGKK
jgi:hypothetical protein